MNITIDSRFCAKHLSTEPGFNMIWPMNQLGSSKGDLTNCAKYKHKTYHQVDSQNERFPKWKTRSDTRYVRGIISSSKPNFELNWWPGTYWEHLRRLVRGTAGRQPAISGHVCPHQDSHLESLGSWWLVPFGDIRDYISIFGCIWLNLICDLKFAWKMFFYIAMWIINPHLLCQNETLNQ